MMSSNKHNHLKKSLVSINQYSKIFLILIVLVLAGLATNFYTEFSIGGLSKYAIKHLAVFAITLVSAIFWRAKLISASTLFLIIIYSNIISSTIYLPFRAQDADLNFEGYFSRVEMIFFVMGLLLAVFERPLHQFVVIGYNTLFIIACTVLIPNIELGKFILAFIIISSVGAISYFVFSKVIVLQNNLQLQNEQIKQQNEELQELTKFRKEIMQIIAHDLRTPMHQISAMVDLILDEKNDIDRMSCMQMLKTTVGKTTGMLEGLLDWSMQSDDSVKSYMHLNIFEVVEDLKSQFQSKLQDKKLNIQNVISQDLKIYYSKQVLETALRNLLTNAIKFSPSDTKILVDTIQDDSSIQFRVINKAHQIDSSKFKLINEGKTVQSSNGTANEKGSGKGLSIVNKILEKNKGKLQISAQDNDVIATIFIDTQELEKLENSTVRDMILSKMSA